MMVERELTPNQIRNRLILVARTIVREHASIDGSCAVCRVAGCLAVQAAVAYLERCGSVARPVRPPVDGREL
jgi:hypothetical protein